MGPHSEEEEKYSKKFVRFITSFAKEVRYMFVWLVHWLKNKKYSNWHSLDTVRTQSFELIDRFIEEIWMNFVNINEKECHLFFIIVETKS